MRTRRIAADAASCSSGLARTGICLLAWCLSLLLQLAFSSAVSSSSCHFCSFSIAFYLACYFFCLVASVVRSLSHRITFLSAAVTFLHNMSVFEETM
jgi:hypothetical protein